MAKDLSGLVDSEKRARQPPHL